MSKLLTVIFIVFASVAAYDASAQAPVVKIGSCPAGYKVSGSYCVPKTPATPSAVKKKGTCPAGMKVSGKYCVSK